MLLSSRRPARRKRRDLLSRSYWWTPRRATSQSLIGQGLAAGLNAQFGSTSGVDANDPTLTAEPALSYTVDDFDEVVHNAGMNGASLSFTAAVVLRRGAATGAVQHVFGKKLTAATANAGWHIALNPTGGVVTRVSDGVTQAADSVALPEAEKSVIVLVANRATGLTTYRFMTDLTLAAVPTVASMAGILSVENVIATRCGLTTGAVLPYNGVLFARCFLPGRALSQTDAQQLARELLSV